MMIGLVLIAVTLAQFVERPFVSGCG
jgi:hypothetical protein